MSRGELPCDAAPTATCPGEVFQVHVASQVKSSQAKSNSKWRSPYPPLVHSLARAIGRANLGATGTTAALDSPPRRGIMFPTSPHVLLWIIVLPFSGIRECKPDPGRRRERSGACSRAAPMGQGVGIRVRGDGPPVPRVERGLESARGPS